MTILGIETSCDETAGAVLTAEKDKPLTLRSNVVASSLSLHAQTGGIIPEIAAREQLKYCLPVIEQALKDAHITEQDLDAIAVTYGPGLIGSLLVGVETARTLSYLWNKPLIPVNHLYGHIYANWIGKTEKAITFPTLALVVSGGHTDLVLMKTDRELQVIGGTRDDAAGEAFDKIGRLLGLPYPAGPVISKLAESGDTKRFTLPRPMLDSGDFDFSFSGLKTAVLNLTKKDIRLSNVILEGVERPIESQTKDPIPTRGLASHEASRPLQDDSIINDLCASVQEAIVDVIVRKTLKAAEKYEVKNILLGGGVAANTKLTETFKEKIGDKYDFFVPERKLCTDNGAMIAAAAFFNQNFMPWQNVTADPELYF